MTRSAGTGVSPAKGVVVSEDRLRIHASTYAFAPHVRVRVDASGENLSVTSLDRTVFDFPLRSAVQPAPISNIDFCFDRGQRTRLNFIVGTDDAVTSTTLNPGPWAPSGKHVRDRGLGRAAEFCTDFHNEKASRSQSCRSAPKPTQTGSRVPCRT